jgi:hypothetical protein
MFFRIACLVLVVSVFTACNDDKKGDDPGGSNPPNGNGGGGGGGGGGSANVDGSNYGKVVIKSSALGLTTAEVDPENCGFGLDIYRGEGACFTPTAVTGFATKVDLVADVAGRGSTRLMSPSEDDQDEGTIWGGTAFDLDATGSSMVGNNTLFSEYTQKPTYTGVSVDFAWVRYQVKVKDKYVSVMLPAYDQPFSDSAMSLCGISADVAAQTRYKQADLLPGMSFKRGDFLFCVKDAADEECATADYMWLDTATKELVATRPSAPKQSAYLQGTSVVCQNEDERYGFNFKLSAVYANIASGDRFKLYGDFSHGELSNQWPGASGPMGVGAAVTPYVIYTFEGPDGAKQEGTELVTTVNFDTTASLFVENLRLTDIDAAELGAVLNALQIKSQWAFDKKFADGVDGGFASHYAGMAATVTVSLSGGTSAPKPADQL